MNEKELLLHQIAAQYITGKDITLALEGKTAEIDSLYELLVVSKELKEALDNKNIEIDKISNLIEEKKLKTKKFQEISNIVWRL